MTKIPFDPESPLRKEWLTASLLASYYHWSPYKYEPEKPLDDFVAQCGHRIELYVFGILSPDYVKVTDSFACEKLKFLATPDGQFTGDDGHYLEIKSVQKRSRETLYFFFEKYLNDEGILLEETINSRRQCNIFSHVIQCLGNLYLANCYHKRKQDFYVLVYYVTLTKELHSFKLTITDMDFFEDFMEASLGPEGSFRTLRYQDPFTVLEFLNITRHNILNV